MKDGSGDLDFGDDAQEEDSEEAPVGEVDEPAGARGNTEEPESESVDETTSVNSRKASGKSPNSSSTKESEYPYFLRREKVGDERSERIELRIREKVKDQEYDFRRELEDALGGVEVKKTDAREFALLAAFENPEKVAELMKDEGYLEFY
jgi:hypothetical protein